MESFKLETTLGWYLDGTKDGSQMTKDGTYVRPTQSMMYVDLLG